jgi:hypothetical protein
VQQIRDFLDFNGRLIATSCRPSPRDCRRDELKPQAIRLLGQGPFPVLKIDLASGQVRLERLQSEPPVPVEGEEAHLRYLNLMYGGRLNVGRSALCREMQAHTLPAGPIGVGQTER